MAEAPPTSPDAVRNLYSELQRYAGWLGKDRASVTLRADLEALAAAIDVPDETLPLIAALEDNIRRLPSGAVRTMLKKTLDRFRMAVDATDIRTGTIDSD